jgi:Dolichyl-phosphate-mannose-protein mannosyltransferase
MYVALAVVHVFLLRPNNNEAWFANPAVDLLVRHKMGTPVLEGSGMWLVGIDRHTYWTMPLYSLVQAPWYWLFGFSLVTQRMLTVLMGVGVLLCLYVLVEKLSDEWAALIAVVLTASDFEFVRLSAQGRMDMMCALLGLGGLAFYVSVRGKNLGRAVLWSNIAAAAACMTHPYGALAMTSLWAIMWHYDRRRLRWADIFRAATPYAAVLFLWLAYILLRPLDFISQFVGNARSLRMDGGNGRFGLLLHPLAAFVAEVRLRYVDHYHSLIVPAVYLLGLVGICVLAWRTRQKGHVAVALIAYFYFVELMLLEGLKRNLYLILSVPVMAMSVAVVLMSIPFPKRIRVAAVVLVVMGMVGYQGRALWKARWLSEGAAEYFSVARFLDANYSTGQPLMAPAEFGYRLGFYGGLTEDWRIGYATGKNPEVLVLGGLGRGWLALHKNDSPEFSEFVDRRLGRDYVVVMDNARYTVYARRDLVWALRSASGDGESTSRVKVFLGLRPPRPEASGIVALH